MKNVHKSYLFKNLTQYEQKLLQNCMKTIELDKGVVFINEGKREESFYILASGQVEVQKHSGIKNEIITTLKTGDSVGEMALLDNLPRSTSAICKTPCMLYQFDIEQLQNEPSMNTAVEKIRKNIHETIANRLRNTNVVTANALKEKYVISMFFIRVLVTIIIYNLSLRIVQILEQYISNTTPITSAILILTTFIVISFIKNSGNSYAYYGVTTQKGTHYAIQAICYTLPILFLLTLVKWVVIHMVPGYSQFQLFDIKANFSDANLFSYDKYFLFMFLYAVFCIIQELIFRCCIQTALQDLMNSNQRWPLFKVLIISNLIFASVHTHLSFGFVLTAFIPGLFWGWIFAKQRSLIGVSASHILSGVWAIFILGFENML